MISMIHNNLLEPWMTYFTNQVFHSHEEALSVVEAKFVRGVAATGKKTADVSEEHGSIKSTEHLSDVKTLRILKYCQNKSTLMPRACNDD